VLLHFLRWLRANGELEPEVLLLAGGELTAEFEAVAHVTLVASDAPLPPLPALLRRACWGDPLVWPPPPTSPLEQRARVAARRLLVSRINRELTRRGAPDLFYLNSTASARGLSVLNESTPLIVNAHEMTYGLEQVRRALPWAVEQMRRRARLFIAGSEAVGTALVDTLDVDPSRIVVCHEAVPANPEPVPQGDLDRVRHELGVAPDALLVGSVGTVSWRKAPDLFLQVAKRTPRRLDGRDVEFVWAGPTYDETEHEIRHDLARANLADRVRFVGPLADPRPLMALLDVFLLTSREDPFPLAFLEATGLGKPVLCFDAGGMTEFIEPDERLVMPYLDVEAMASRLVELLESETEREAIGAALARRMAERHTVDGTAPLLLEHIQRTLREAS